MSLTLTVQCLLIIVASLVGGMLPDWVRLTHKRMQLVMSYVGGLMLGIALLHLLPHAAHELGSVDHAALAMLVGLLAMFMLLRMFHFHEHEPLHPPHAESIDCGHDHGAHHDHGAAPAQGRLAAHRMSWGGVAFGLSVHTLIDGMALAAAVQTDLARPDANAALAGLNVFLAVFLHKPLDAVSVTSLMAAGGWSHRTRLGVNAAFAAMCPLGAVLFALGLDIEAFAGIRATLLGCALAFSAGVFVCISLSDLLPEIEFHTHDRVGLSVTLAVGILTAALLSAS